MGYRSLEVLNEKEEKREESNVSFEVKDDGIGESFSWVNKDTYFVGTYYLGKLFQDSLLAYVYNF